MQRIPGHPIDSIFLERWSPRAFDSSAIPDEDLFSMFEAARWAPSAFNLQPWRYLYARRDDAEWQLFLSLLIPFNQSWAAQSSVIVFALSASLAPTKTGENAPSHSHSFDAGAAWAYLALEAHKLGYAAHGMTGIDFSRAQVTLGIPDDHRIEAAIALGRRANAEILPDQLRARETPSSRVPIEKFVRQGVYAW